MLVHALGLLVLAVAEIACYLALKKAGLSTPASVGVALIFCLSVFLFIGIRLSAQPTRSSYRPSSPRKNYGSAQGPSTRLVIKRSDADGDDDFHVPTSMSSAAHTRSEAFLTELYSSLTEKRDEFSKLLAECSVELGRFDYGVLKTLERNSPGSVEGVVTARKIFHALERRVKDIEHFLNAQGTIDPEKGKVLLLGDLEVKEENQLTTLFKSAPVPPIKISEVEFQLRVLLKRITRRRSIFRPSEMARETGRDENPELVEIADSDEDADLA